VKKDPGEGVKESLKQERAVGQSSLRAGDGVPIEE